MEIICPAHPRRAAARRPRRLDGGGAVPGIDDDGVAAVPDQPASQQLRPRGPEGLTLIIGGGHADGLYQGHLVMAGALEGGVHYHRHEPVPESERPVPHQIPTPPPLQGRARERAELAELVAAPEGALVVVSGAAASGAALLAAEALCRLDPPGGHLYADLGAGTPHRPAAPHAVLCEFLTAVGAPVPDTLSERAGEWRTATSHWPVALLLDNAFSAAQARALRPGGSSVTVVTASSTLSGLVVDGARLLLLDPPPEGGEPTP
jgi:hypothetical protein